MIGLKAFVRKVPIEGLLRVELSSGREGFGSAYHRCSRISGPLLPSRYPHCRVSPSRPPRCDQGRGPPERLD